MDSKSQTNEKKQAAILFANIIGINDLSENKDPDYVTDLLNKILELVDVVVTLYEGSIEKFGGDELTAVFGIPDYNEKTPINAVNAAVELQNKIIELSSDSEQTSSINIKIGIQTGSVLVGKIGSAANQRSMLMGEAISVASRICDLAENGQILTGHEIYNITKEKFDFQALEPLPIKGRKKPLPVFEVKGRKRVRITTGVKQKRMINSAMVGRDKEYRLLEKQIMQLIQWSWICSEYHWQSRNWQITVNGRDQTE